jgi:AAA domain
VKEESRPARRLPGNCTARRIPPRLDGNPGLTLQALSEVVARNVRWLVTGLIPLRTLTLVAGVGGLGKSMWLAGVAARLSRGELEGHEPGHSVIVSYEDTAAEILRPRIEAAGADPSRVHHVIREHRDYVEPVALPRDVIEVERLVRSVEAKLLIIDPIVAAIDTSLDAHKDQHVRVVLARLAELADVADCAVALVGHLNKAPSTDAYIRVANSVGFWNASRSVVLITEDGDDDSRLIAQRKANYARLRPVERHRIEPVVLPHLKDPTDGRAAETARMVFVEYADEVDGADVLGGKTTKTETAETLLEAVLADGEWHEAEGVKTLMKKAGHAERTTQRAAKYLGVEYERRGMPSITWWRIPLASATAPPVAPPPVAPSPHSQLGATEESAEPSGSEPSPATVAPAPSGEEADDPVQHELDRAKAKLSPDSHQVEPLVLRLVPENAATEAALLKQMKELAAEGIGSIEERPA